MFRRGLRLKESSPREGSPCVPLALITVECCFDLAKRYRLSVRFSDQLRTMIKSRGRLLRAIGLPLIYMAMFSIAGGYWAALQVVAWTQMVHTYSRNAGVVDALIKTFDGKHPCTLCGKVKEGREKQKSAPASVKVSKKTDVFAASASDKLQQRLFENFSFPRLVDFVFSARTEAPPRPVPRVFLS
jgi:hypothetical protein